MSDRKVWFITGFGRELAGKRWHKIKHFPETARTVRALM